MFDKAIQLNPLNSDYYNNNGLKLLEFRKFPSQFIKIWGICKNVWQNHTNWFLKCKQL